MNNQVSILGNMQNGILILDQGNPIFPPNPNLNDLVILKNVIYLYTIIANVTKWYPLVQRNFNPTNYVGQQTTSSFVWTVKHNLNTSNYYYQITDNNGNKLTPVNLISVDSNTFKLEFNTSCVGTVVVVDTDNLFIDELAIGDGTNVQITQADQEQLNFVPGDGIDIKFDNNTKSIIISTVPVTRTIDLPYSKIDNYLGNTTNTNSNQILDSSLISEIRTARYFIQISSANGFQCEELILLHDNINVSMLEISNIFTNNMLATFDANIVSNELNLLVSPLQSNLTINLVKLSQFI